MDIKVPCYDRGLWCCRRVITWTCCCCHIQGWRNVAGRNSIAEGPEAMISKTQSLSSSYIGGEVNYSILVYVCIYHQIKYVWFVSHSHKSQAYGGASNIGIWVKKITCCDVLYFTSPFGYYGACAFRVTWNDFDMMLLSVVYSEITAKLQDMNMHQRHSTSTAFRSRRAVAIIVLLCSVLRPTGYIVFICWQVLSLRQSDNLSGLICGVHQRKPNTIISLNDCAICLQSYRFWVSSIQLANNNLFKILMQRIHHLTLYQCITLER